MRQYIDLFTEHEALLRENSPSFMNGMRQKALKDFASNGFPSLKDEDYRHTDVAKAFAPDYGLNLQRIKIPVNPFEAFGCDVPNLSTQLFFMVNDSFYEDYTPKVSLPEGVYAGGFRRFADLYPEVAARYYGSLADTAQDSITAINTMFAQDGFVLYVGHDVKVERSFQLVNIFHSEVDIMANRRMLIIMEPRSAAKLLVCDHTMDSVNCLATQVIEIFADEGAYFDYYDLEESTVDTSRFSSLYVRQQAHSNVLVNGITLVNGLTRNNYRIKLEGEYAETMLCGMSVLDGSQQVDVYSHITHQAPKCRSNELFKNVLNDNSTGVFSGRILVCEGAQKTEAYQSNRNMCMTSEARMYGKPQLEIYTDDVKCSHGMTTGQIDEQALFYMQSRGVSRDEARRMLSVAFTADVIDNVRLDALKNRLHYLVDKRFRGELVHCADCRCKKCS